MRLLVLGGTKFLGRATVEAALERGHEVTLFNRGETNPELFPEAEKLRGDRDGDLSALEGREWDAVIDPSGFVPRLVRASAEALQGSVGQYVFVSSVSVYDELGEPGFDETARTVTLEDPTTEDYLTMGPVNTYGGLKALCEEVVREVFPDSHAVVRPGLIVGPHDPSGNDDRPTGHSGSPEEVTSSRRATRPGRCRSWTSAISPIGCSSSRKRGDDRRRST